MKATIFTMLGILASATAQQPSAENQSASQSYGYGTIRNVCGPTDAIELLLALTPQPIACGDKTPREYIRLSLSGPFPKTITFPAGNPHLQAAKCVENEHKTKCEAAVSGKITIDANGREGHYELKFKDGDEESSDFKVRECMSRIVCG
ncbi:MAG TPA: hypothetical protein VF753_14130 [Terriglobales bacterium]